MEKLRFGIIGCGSIANSKHIPTLLKQPQAEIVALCDIAEDRARAAAKKFELDGVKIYTDYKDLCDDQGIDVVHICTPNVVHCEITLAAVAGGKHVHCEKPLACTWTETQKMITAARKAGKRLTSGLQWRFRENCFYIRDLVQSGMLGDVYYVKSQQLRRRMLPAYGAYTSKAGNGGGVLMDGGPHSIDLAMWLTGNYKPKSVRGVIMDKMKFETEANMSGPWDPTRFDVEDSAFALLTMENGMAVSIEVAWLINMIQEAPSIVASLAGTKAGVDMVGAGMNPARVNMVYGGRTATLVPDLAGPLVAPFGPTGADYEMIHWIDAILNDKEPAVKAEEAAVVTQVIEGIYKSADTGETIYF